MKAQRTGAMIGFTIGMTAGLCATSNLARNWITGRLPRGLRNQNRNIIDAKETELSTMPCESPLNRLKRKIRSRFAISARARIIRRQKSKTL